MLLHYLSERIRTSTYALEAGSYTMNLLFQLPSMVCKQDLVLNRPLRHTVLLG
jgi:hypothetical protein